MEQDFLIRLQAKLDEAKAKTGITEDIRKIENQIDSLKLQVSIDEKSIQNVIRQLDSVLNQKNVGNNLGDGIQKSVEASLQNTKKLIADTFKNLPKLNASDLISKFNLNSKDIDTSVVTKVRNITQELNKLASEAVNTNSDSAWSGVIKNIVELGNTLNQFGKVKADISQYENVLRIAEELKRTKIYVDPSVKNDVLSGTNVSSLKELNNELINMKVSFTSAATGAKNLDAVWDEFINSTNRFDLSNITNSADRITAIVNELRKAKDVMYGDKAFQSANGFGTEEMLNWVNTIEQASKKMGVYRQEEVDLERQLAEIVVESEKKKQDAIKQTQDVKAKQSNTDRADNSLANEKRLLDFDAKRKKVLQEIATYLSQNTKLTASNTKEAKELEGNFEKIRREVQSIARGDNVGLNTLSKQLTTAKLKAKELGLEGSSLSDEFGKLFKRFNSWFSVGQFSFAVSNKIEEAVQEIKELDTILTEISKTSDLTTSQLNELGDSAFDTASKYGKKASDYLTGVQEMYRAGYENAKEMAELSTLAQSAGDMDATTANDYLIATDAAYDFKGSVEELNKVLDSQNFITNNAAVCMDDMASATSEAASIAAQYGVEVNELSSLIAVVASKTRESGSEVGTALKSIFVNLQDTTNSTIVKAFETAGVSMTEMVDGSEKLKTPIELLKELSDVFTSLEEGSTVRATILNDIGSKYHANTLSAILSDWSSFEKMMDLYSKGEGSAFNEAQKSATNLESALNRINNTITDIVNNVASSQLLTDSANGLNDILSLINQLTDKLGALGTISVVGAGIIGANKNSSLNLTNMIAQYKDLTGAVTRYNTLSAKAGFTAEKFNSAMQSNNTIMGEYLKSLNGAKASFGGYIQYLATAKVSTIALSAATTAMNMALSMGTAFLISSAITALSDFANKADEAREKSTELSNSWKDNNTSLNDTISQYKELNEKLKDSSLSSEEVKSVKEQLTTIQNNLNQAYGDEADSIDLVNGKYDEQIKKLETLSKKKAQDYIAENSENVKEDKKYLEDIISRKNTTDMARYDTNLGNEKDEKQYKEAEKIYKKYLKKYEALSLGYDYYKGTTGLRLNLEGTREDIQTQLSQLFAELNEDYADNPPEFIQGLKDVITKTLNMDDFDTTKIEDAKKNVKTYTEAEVLANTKTRNLYNESIEAVEAYNNALSEGKGIDKAKQNLDDIKAKVSEAVKGYEGYDTVFNDIFDAIQKTDSKIAEKTSNIKDTVANADKISFIDKLSTEDYEDISKELKTLAEAGELTPNTLTSTKEYNALLKDTNTSAQEATEQLYNMIDANERLATFSSNMGNVDKAYAEFKTNGFNTMDTLSSMQGAFGDLDYYNKFIKIAGDAKSSTEQIQEAYNKLVTEYVYSIGILDTVNESNRGMIQTQLEQLGITNAEEIVTQALNGEIMTLTNAKAILAQYSLDLESVTRSELDALVKEGKLSNETANQIATLALKKQACNLNTITTNGDIQNLAALAGVGTKAAQILAKIAEIKKNISSGDGAPAEAMASSLENLQKQLQKELNKGNSVNFNVDYSGGTSTTDAVSKANKEATKSTTKFSQAIDWCAQTLSKLSKTIDLYSAKLENNTNSVKTQIKYYKQLLTAQNNVVKGYAKTESKYKSQYNKALKKLSASDQKKVKNGTYTIEQFSGKAKSGSTSKEEKRYNNIQSALEARDNYLDSQTDLVNAKNQLQEFAEALALLRWENATEQVEKLNGELELLDLKLSNANGYKAKNEIVDQQLKVQKQIINKQKNAISNTQNDADVYYAKISAKNKKNKNADGTIKTAGVTNQTQLKYIKIYNAYVRQLAEETLELQKAEEEYQSAVNESAITKAENVKAEYDNKISLIDAKENRLNSEIALAEAKGQVASAEYYKLLNANSDERMAQLKEEKTELESQLATLEPYSDAWYEVKQATIEVDEAIAEETLNAVENINKQIEAIEALTKAKNDYLSSAIGTYDWLESLTDTDDYYNEDGSFSDKGMVIIKSKIDKVKLYEQQAKNDQATLAELGKKYANGEIDEATYLNEKIELTEDLQNVTKSMYDEQQSLHDMYIDGLKEESEALQELIDKKMESLNASKAEADYQKSISNKVKNITDLEKQLAMLEGDNSEEARAKRQKVQVQLEEAQQDLKDTQYDKYLERLENSLGDLQDRFDAVIEKLDKQGAIPSIEELSTLVDSNSASVVNGVDKIIKDAGLDSLLGEKGIGYLNDATTSLLTSPVSKVSTKIDTVNTWLGNIYDATVGSTANKDNDSNNVNPTTSTSQTPSVTGGITGTIGVNQLPTPSTELTTKMNSQVSLTQRKAKEFIDQNATKAKKKQSEYGILNKKIYEITGGKILSKENRVKLAELLGIGDADNSGDITGAEAKKIVALLENAGFANGGIVEAVHKSGDDGIAKLKVGEAVLTPVQTTAFTKLAENIVPFNNLIGDIVERPNIPMVDRSASMSSTSIDNINVEFSLPNVTDKESFKDWLQNDGWINRYFDSMITNKTVGGNKRFGTNRL